MHPLTLTKFVFVINKPSSDLHEEERFFRTVTREEAEEQAAECGRATGLPLRLVAIKEWETYLPVVPFAELPWWLQEAVTEQEKRRLAKTRGRRLTDRGAA